MEQRQMSIDRSVLTSSQAFSELRDEQPKETIITTKKKRSASFFNQHPLFQRLLHYFAVVRAHTHTKKNTLDVKKKRKLQ